MNGDFEPEKRENPYKKQNPYKKKRESEQLPPEEQTAGKTETFFTSHIRLITFLVCLGLFLVFLGPVSIWQISEWVQEAEQAEEEESYLPLSALLAIADKGAQAGWKDFRAFGKSEAVNDEDGYVSWNLQVKDEPFYVIVGGYGTLNPPQTIRVYSLISGESVDLFRDDVQAFIEQNRYKQEHNGD